MSRSFFILLIVVLVRMLPASAAAATVAPIDTSNRRAVVKLFHDVYVPTVGLPAVWTGNLQMCASGGTSAAYKEATITRVNYYRTMAGLPGTVVLDNSPDADYQDAALMMAVNLAANHTPPTSWRCYTEGGARVALLANLEPTAAGPEAIGRYMDDDGFSNEAVGHRRWVLYPPQQKMLTGSVLAPGIAAGNALMVQGVFGSRPATPAFVSWPPPGFVPYQILPSGSGRWSFSIAGADFSSSTVSVMKAGVAITSTLLSIASGYGDNTLVWRVSGISYGAPPADEAYVVTVSNVRIGATLTTFTYTVTVIDPGPPPSNAPTAPTNLRISP